MAIIMNPEELVETGPPRPRRERYRSNAWVRRILTLTLVSLAVAALVLQQLHRTPWGLPGHRTVFWLTTLIAVRWCLDRPGTALRVAALSSCIILYADATTGVHVLSYLAAALLVDRAAENRTIRAHPWSMLALAPLIALVNLASPFLHNLALFDVFTVLGGMWFYIKGHLLWGTAAGFLGLSFGLGGRRLLRALPEPH